MKYTRNFNLPLYEYKDGADLVKGYNKTALFIDENIAKVIAEHGTDSFDYGNGTPSIDETSKIGDIYIDLDTNSIWLCNKGYDGKLYWIRIADDSRPSRWFAGEGSPTSGEEYERNDMYLDTTTADVWMFVGNPAEGLEVDASEYPIKLVQNGKIIGYNWFYDQGQVDATVDAVGQKDIEGCPSVGVTKQTKRLPIASYITPFSIKASMDMPYDLYYRLSSSKFDSGRHFEHHASDQTEYYSEAEVAITHPTSYSECIFTVNPGDNINWHGQFSFTTFGLYQAYDYANMLEHGVKWFDKTGHIEYAGPWIKICNLASYVTGTIPNGGLQDQVLMKSSDKDYDIKWANVNASQVVYLHNGKHNVSEAVDDLFDKAAELERSDKEQTDSMTDLFNAISNHRQVPDGGTTGQILQKTSSSYGWATPPAIATDEEAIEFIGMRK